MFFWALSLVRIYPYKGRREGRQRSSLSVRYPRLESRGLPGPITVSVEVSMPRGLLGTKDNQATLLR
jgi:hypothetical protein